MFRTLIYPSSGACDCVVELPHPSSCSHFVVCWRFGAADFEWCSFCRLKPCFFFSFSTYSHVNRLPLTRHGKIFTGILPRRAVLREHSDITQCAFSDFQFILSMVYFRRFQCGTNSFCSLSYDRSIASSKTNSP